MSKEKEKLEENKEGVRFDAEKQRHDLIPPFAIEQLTKILTFGAKKYKDRNWEKGMQWSRVISSLKRHLHEIEKGNDYDDESGELHIAHLLCNAVFLCEFYKIHPQGDDRPHWYLREGRIALDIDDVISDFLPHYIKHFKIETKPTFWNFDDQMQERLEQLKTNEDFWLSIPPKVDAEKLPFTPVCYITNRICSEDITKKWLSKHSFPMVPIIQGIPGKGKAAIAKEMKIDIFVDDNFNTFVEMNKTILDEKTNKKICCYLMTTPQNEKYPVGHKRIYKLEELAWMKKSK